MEGPSPRFISLHVSAVLLWHSSDFVPLFWDIRPSWTEKRRPGRMVPAQPAEGSSRIDQEKSFSDGTYLASRIPEVISKVLEDKVDMVIGDRVSITLKFGENRRFIQICMRYLTIAAVPYCPPV